MRTGNPAFFSACPYDVGDVLITSSAKNPTDRWPGTARKKLQDRFLLASGNKYSVNSTGGAETVTLTVAQMPSHHHEIYMGEAGTTDYWGPVTVSPITTNHSYSGRTGGSQPHNNMPPYLVRHMWERTA